SNAYSGINIENGSPLISNSTVSGMPGNGITVTGNSSPTLTGNMVTGNGIYGLFYGGGIVLTATNNNWGDPSGPLDDSDDRATGGLYNPTGKGNKVSDKVNYYPWIGTPPTAVAVPTNLTGLPRYSAALLRWNAGTNPVPNGYRLYYGTAAGTYGTPLLLTDAASHKLTGLSIGQPYFFSISALNSIGAESDKSQEITVTPIGQYIFDLAITGSGKGQVVSTPGGIATNISSEAFFNPGTAVSLHSSAEEYSLFSGWSDACTGTDDCHLTMDADYTATASFGKDTEHAVLIDTPSTTYYPALQQAFLAALPSAVIKAWGTDFTENLLLNKNGAVTIKGGFNEAYTSNSGKTTLHGTLTVRKGKVIVENLLLR
ncbi:MAG: hypothetical protein ACOYL3_22605, partial [Desulfuromonadaceae bacterium]